MYRFKNFVITFNCLGDHLLELFLLKMWFMQKKKKKKIQIKEKSAPKIWSKYMTNINPLNWVVCTKINRHLIYPQQLTILILAFFLRKYIKTSLDYHKI